MNKLRSPLAVFSPSLSVALLVAGSFLPANGSAGESSTRPAIPAPSDLIGRLHPGHPRLLASTNDFQRLKERVRTDPTLRSWYAQLTTRAGRVLAEAPARYEIPDGLRLLATSRRVLDRVYLLALAYRLDPQDTYRDRLWRELAAAAAFPDWNPRHFLDTAEMTHAFAIAYDWLDSAWSADQRQTLRSAMIEKGLRPALASYRGAETYGWWVKAHHNWNQVCNGGIGLGALAIGDEEPALAGEILHAALQSLPLAMAEYAPDGAWQEGPGYWHYATSYNVVFLAGLTTALGTDFGLAASPAFGDTGWFPIYMTGPLGRTFNYADGSDGTIRAPEMFWLASRFDHPAYQRYQRQRAAPQPLDLLWFSTAPDGTGQANPALAKYFRGAELATMRSAWDDPQASFVALKGGDNQANHSHLDLGTFVLDALGVRWGLDLGADDYNLPAYFGRQRWTYYRLRAEGHNTLVINPGQQPDQNPSAAARIVRFATRPQRSFAVIDLTPAYAAHAQSVQRGLALAQDGSLEVQDEVKAATPVDLWWFFHTSAEVQLGADGVSATLVQGDKRLAARLLSPTGATFSVMAAEPLPTSPHPERQAHNDRVRKLAIHLASIRDLRLAVLFAPVPPAGSAVAQPPPLESLAAW